MAHDISVYIEKEGKKKEVSYLRIQAFDINTSFFLYNSLNSEEFSRGISGNSGRKIFSYKDVITAKSKFNYMITEDEQFIDASINKFIHDNTSKMISALEDIFGEKPIKVESFSDLSPKDKKYIQNKLNHFFDEILMNIKENDKVEILFA
jgi:hypothetical protein